LILKGEVALETSVKEGGIIPIQTLGGGDVLGWSWLFPPYYWHFDARAVSATETVFFYGTRLRERCEEDHDLGYELIKRMAHVVIRRLQATRRQLVASTKKRISLDRQTGMSEMGDNKQQVPKSRRQL
jgi:CRP-like cAMP-binding protein